MNFQFLLNGLIAYNFDHDFWYHDSTDVVVYHFANITSDLLNYVVFVLINMSIDIYMVVRLRRTLIEKSKRLKNLYASDSPRCDTTATASSTATKSKELDVTKSIENAIRMVTINSTLNILLKLPLCFLPLMNAIMALKCHLKVRQDSFMNFYGEFIAHFLDFLFENLSELLFIILISVQLFIYVKFDNKMKIAFWRCFIKVEKNVDKSLFKDPN